MRCPYEVFGKVEVCIFWYGDNVYFVGEAFSMSSFLPRGTTQCARDL